MRGSGFFRIGCLLLLSLVSALGVRGTAAERTAESLVRVERGPLPIVLSVPHGGSELIPGVPERRQGARRL